MEWCNAEKQPGSDEHMLAVASEELCYRVMAMALANAGGD